MSKVLIVCASPRPDSSSSKVAAYLGGLVTEAGHALASQTFLGLEIRSIGQGYIQPGELTEPQTALLEALRVAETVIWVVPEYNRGVPAEMIAFLEHFGEQAYSYIWTDKVHAVAGVSSGVGGREPIYYLAKVLGYVITSFGAGRCYVSPHSFQSVNTGDQFDDQGALVGQDRYALNAKAFITKLLS